MNFSSKFLTDEAYRLIQNNLLFFLLLPILSALLVGALSAQNPTVDQKLQVDKLIELARVNEREDSEKAIQYAKEGQSLSRSIGYHNGQAMAQLALARIYIITSQYDSATSSLASTKTIITKNDLSHLEAKLYDEYGWLAQRQREFEQSLEYLWKAKSKLNDLNQALAASINTNLGITHYFMSAFDSSLVYYDNALNIAVATNDSLRMFNGMRNIGIVLRRQGEMERAVELYFNALRIAEGLKLRSGQADIHNSLGVAYDQLKENEKALEHYKYSLELRRTLGDKKRLANVLSNIGWIYSEMGQLEQALASHLESLEISEQIGGHTSKDAAYNNIGLVYKAMGQLELARDYFQKSLREYQQKKNQGGMVIAINNLASVHFAREEYQKTINLQLEYLNRLKQHGDLVTQLNGIERLYLSYKALNKVKEALAYHEQLKVIKDSIFDIERRAEVLELSTRFETEKKEAALKFKDEEIQNLEKQADLRNRLMWTYAATIFLVGILLMGILYYRHQRRKANHIADKKLMAERLINEQLEKEMIVAELETKKKELLSFALNVTQKNDLLRRLSELVRKKIEYRTELRSEFKELETLIQSNDHSEKDWENFKTLFQELHHNFFNNLKKAHAGLTVYEVRLAALTILNLNNHEVASMLNISTSSLTSARYRLRKKLELTGKDDLNAYLSSFNGL